MERPLLQNPSADELQPQKSPNKLQYRYNTSGLDKFFFGWIAPVIDYANRRGLSQDVLEDLSAEEQSQSVYYKFNDYWNEQKATNPKDPLKKALDNTFKTRLTIGFIYDFLAYVSTILVPVVIYFFAEYLENDNQSPGWDVFYLLIIPFIRFTRSFFDGHGSYVDSSVGTEMSNCVSISMVNKAMKYSVLCNKAFKLGEISSLMQVDCFRLSLLPRSFNAIIDICFCLIFGIVFMGIVVSYSFLAGFAVLLVISIFNILISRFTAKNQQQFSKATDQRMKVTNEVFNNIKFIKVNAWEEYFYDKLMARRTNQVHWLRKKMLSEAAATFTMWLAPKFILAATYILFVQIGNTLKPQITFSIMSLYGYLQFYLQILPNALSVVIECNNAIKRIQNFLLAEEINLSCITYDRFNLPSSTNKENAIEVQNGNFYWDKDDEEAKEGVAPKETDLNLVDMNFNIKRGEMVAIIGGIGAGKSSLMYSLLGQMKYKENLPKPRVVVNGSLSLVTQKPWIVNDTVRNSIVFGQRFEAAKYKQVIKYACLQRDFELFTHGDQTMIGEKGATLSGGQKARISFARSLYSNSDILLLDDLLSAVDVHVGKFMMTETLLGYSRSKTRILITHALYYLKYVDKVLLMEDGHIAQQGTYEQIKNTSRFKAMYESMMKDEKKKRATTIKILALEAPEKDGELAMEGNIEDQIEQEIIREASIHTKKSKTASAIDRNKLQALRQRKSKISNIGQVKVEVKEESKPRGNSKKQVKVQVKVKAQASNQNELMMAEQVSEVSALKLYNSYAKYNLGWGYMSLIILIQIIWMACNSVTNLWLIEWTDFYAKQTDNIHTDHDQNFYIVGYVIFGAIYAFLALCRSLLIAYSSPRMSLLIHETMISNLLFSSLNEFFDRVPLGRIFNRLSKDLNSVDLSVSVALNNVFVFSFFLASSILTINVCAEYYVFLPIIALYLVCCHFLRMHYSKAASQLTKIEGITKSPIVSCFTEILSGVATIRSYKKEDMFMHNNCLKIDENKKPILARKAVEVWFTLRLMLISYMMTYAALAYSIFWPASGNQNYQLYQKASSSALLTVSALGFDEVMYFLFNNLGILDGELISIERCQSFMNLEPEAGYVQYLKNREQLKIKSKERRMMKAQGWPDKGRIDFIDLKCRYRKNLDLVLRGLNVTFTGGHKIGVVGRTGSGKSTIMMCLLRILEAADGKILIDGRDISQLSLDDLRSKITIILQDPCLFAGTIRENLDPLHEYDDERLSKCLELCALKEMIDSRQGLETPITENGENLSAGQRQLISICRAILKPTRIVLVDEATANIDVKTESIIYKAMNEGFKHSTVITVAHRLNTVINSDRILVLEGGLLKEFDNPQELLKNPNSFFAQLYNESLKENKM